MDYLKDNRRIFDNLTGTLIVNAKLLKIPTSKVPKTEPEAARELHNPNVSKILPLTTFRTIDLGGGKISGRLFSRFCAEMRVFFEMNCAPEFVQYIGAAQSTKHFRTRPSQNQT